MLILLNPAKEQVTVKADGQLSDNASYQLIDLIEKFIINGSIRSTVTTIQLSQAAFSTILVLSVE